MSSRPTVGGVLILALLVSACSSSSDPSRDSANVPQSSKPTTGGPPSGASTTGTSTTDPLCPELVADIPADLAVRRTKLTDGITMPASTGVIWANKQSTRVVNLSTNASNEPFGDGVAAKPRKRQVQGTTAREIVNGDVHRITWRQPGATQPCKYWGVVVQGLSQRELDTVLQSVKERT